MIGFALLALIKLTQAPMDSLHGVVRAAGTGEGIPGVRVSLVGHVDVVFTNASGRYVVHHPLAERLELQFERLGYQPLVVDVTAVGGGGASVDVDLAPAAVPLAPVAVTPSNAGGLDPPAGDSAEVGHVHLTEASARQNPLVGESDVLAGLTAAPFVSSRGDVATSLRVHGGSDHENLVLIDGLPWRGPRPPGGVSGMLPSTAIASVDVHTDVPPVRYGDALSSIIVLRPQIVQRQSAEGSVDLNAVEQAVGAPLGRQGALGGASLFVAGRISYRPVWGQADETGKDANWFGDVFAHLTGRAAGGAIDLYGVTSKHDFAFPARPELADRDSATPSVAPNEFAASGSLGGMVWTDSLGEDRRAQVRAWYSEVGGRTAWDSLHASSSLREVGGSADYTSPQTEAGLSFSRIATHYRATRDSGAILAMDAAPVVASAYAARRWTPVPFWTVSTGLRLNAATPGGWNIEPRVWTRVMLGYGPHSPSIFLGLARVHQYVLTARNDESVVDGLIGATFPIAAGSAGMPPARSDQLSGAIRARLGGRADVQLDVYTRRMSGLALVPLATTHPFTNTMLPVGRGSGWGVDATLTYPADRVQLILQAGLLSSYRTLGTVRYQSRDPGGRLAVGMAYRMSRSLVGRLSFWAGAGRRTTLLRDGVQLESSPLLGTGELAGSPEALAGPLNRCRLRNYARLDLGFLKSWGQSRSGPSRISTALTVSDLFNHRNTLGLVATPTGPRPVFLPSRTLFIRLRWSLAR